MNSSDHDGQTPVADASSLSTADSFDVPLHDLLPVIAMLDRVGRQMSKPLAQTDGEASEDVSSGSLGEFRLVRVIGRGGMGVVYEAVQESLNRRVALKILPRSSSDDFQRVRRFQVEAQAAACLHHPHIVPVYVVGSHQDIHYFAMQLIEGQTLADSIASSRLRVETSIQEGCVRDAISAHRFHADLARQAAEALHFAHEQGVLHRDIKPANLLIDNSGWLWVADFGLARIAGEGDLTATGALLGTLRYMSPEQVVGARMVVDHRTDIYSLGATLYESLTLRPAFDGDNRLELSRKIAHDHPRPPRGIDPTIPRDLDTIVRKAMAKEPSDRYATALEFAEDLGRFLENRPIAARPPGPIEHAARWARTHKTSVTAAALVVVAALICLAAIGGWRNNVLRRHNTELASALELAERNQASTRRLWYDSRIKLAQQSCQSGQVELARDILDGLRPDSPGHDLRGFEWHYLWRECNRVVSVLTNHETQVLALAQSSDGRVLATGDDAGVIVLTDLDTESEIVRFQGHERSIAGLAFSPDRTTLASWTWVERMPSEVKLWNAGSGRPLSTVPGIEAYANATFSSGGRSVVISEYGWNETHAPPSLKLWNLSKEGQLLPGSATIRCDRMACSPNGRWLATGLQAGSSVTLRDAATGQPIKTFHKRLPGIGGMLFSADGHTLAAHTPGLTVWDTHSGRELGSLPNFLWKAASFSPDASRLAAVTVHGKTIELVDNVRTKPREIFLEKLTGQDLHFAFSADGKLLAGGGIDSPATLWDPATGRKLTEYQGKTGGVGDMVFTTGKKNLIFACDDGRVRSWHFGRKAGPTIELAGHQAEVWDLAYSPDGATLISCSDDRAIKLWNSSNGKSRATLEGHESLVASLAISPDGKLVASAGFDNTVRLWDLPGGQSRGVLTGHSDRVRVVAFSPDGRTIASAGSDKTIRVWDVNRREPVLVFTGHTDTIRALAFHPSFALLVSSGNDRTIRGVDLTRKQERFLLPSPKHTSALVFSPDGSLLASGDEWGNVVTWNVDTLSRRATVKESDAEIWDLAFSPDGRTLAAACGDAKVRLSDPITGQVTLVLGGHTQRVNAVAFAPGGRTLASASHDGEIRLWHATSP